MEIKDIIERLKGIQKFNLCNYVESEYAVSTEREYAFNGDYIDSYDLDYFISELEIISHEPEE